MVFVPSLDYTSKGLTPELWDTLVAYSLVTLGAFLACERERMLNRQRRLYNSCIFCVFPKLLVHFLNCILLRETRSVCGRNTKFSASFLLFYILN